MSYQPQEAYSFQSGKHAGKYLEILAFQNYSFLNWLLQKIRESQQNNNKNTLHQHLEWLLSQGENRPVPMLCPHCGLRPIKWISVLGSCSIGLYFTCCENKECRDRLCAWADDRNTFLEIKFSCILQFGNKQDQKQFVELLRAIFGAPKHLTRNWAFQFFSY